jgi:hypothetical protein
MSLRLVALAMLRHGDNYVPMKATGKAALGRA